MIARLAFALSLLAALPACSAPEPPPHTQGYEIVRTYPHDRQAFTEGLLFRDGLLYESTGLEGRSWVRRVTLETGAVQQQADLDPKYFGEGIVDWGDKLVQLTWKDGVGFVRDRATFAVKSTFNYQGEGWSLTRDERRIIMSDGTDELRFLDPETLKETGRVKVTEFGQPVDQINELEFIKGEVWANVWQTDQIIRIDPKTGNVVGRLDLSGLLTADEARHADVLNGIAYDAKGDRIFVTGKFWPWVFEIKVAK